MSNDAVSTKAGQLQLQLQLVTVLAYDARMRLTSRSVGGEVTTYTYDDAGQLKKVTLPDSSFLEYTYDAAHRLTEVKDNLNNKIAYTLDLMGNRTAENVYDPLGTLAQTRTRVISSLNRLSQEIGAASQTTTYGYDSQGNVTSIDGPLSGTVDVTTNVYDELNRLKQVIDAKSGQVNYTYDKRDQLTQVSDPRSLATAYTRDGLGNLTQQVSPDTGTTTNTYDAAGNLLTTTDARGKTGTYTYDALNRVTQVVWPDATITYTYDQGTNGKGRLTKMTDPTGNTQWSYDAHGRVIRKWQQNGARVFVVEYAYDAQGRLSAMTYPSGRAVSYTYDSAGRVASVSVDGSPIASSITYRPFGQPKSWTWGNSQSYVRTFDLDGRLKTHPLGASTRTITYDVAGRITQLDEGSAPTTRTYGYDELDRLTSFIYGSTSQSFGYDANGNRTSLTVGASNYSYAYPGSSNRLSSTAGPTARTYSYDNVGNVTGDGTRTFNYNDRGRLNQVTFGTSSYAYGVNGLGQRFTRSGTGISGTLRYVYDESGRTIGSYDNNGNLSREVVFLGDTPIAVMHKSAQEVLVDNGAAAPAVTIVGTWSSQTTDQGYYGSNYRRKAAGSGSATFTWTPTVPAAQSYSVYARWAADTDHATNAPFTVHHAGGSNTVNVNQRLSGGEWNLLGTFSLAPGANHRVVLTDNANGVVVADAIKIVPVSQTAVVSYIHADHLNTPLRVLNQSNQLRWVWDPAPFGDTAANENPSGLGAYGFGWRFPGQFFDFETGLHYNYFRDYDPSIGRYIQSDPIGLMGGINTYAYVGSNPLSFSDPTGEAVAAAPAIPLCIANPLACGVVVIGGLVLASPGARDAISTGLKTISQAICNSSIDECKKICDDAYYTQIETVCKKIRTRSGRRQCYENAAILYGECLAKCK